MEKVCHQFPGSLSLLPDAKYIVPRRTFSTLDQTHRLLPHPNRTLTARGSRLFVQTYYSVTRDTDVSDQLL